MTEEAKTIVPHAHYKSHRGPMTEAVITRFTWGSASASVKCHEVEMLPGAILHPARPFGGAMQPAWHEGSALAPGRFFVWSAQDSCGGSSLSNYCKTAIERDLSINEYLRGAKARAFKHAAQIKAGK
jgi:hypothetical protein